MGVFSMAELTTNIKIEIHCEKPSWAFKHYDYRINSPIYRIYVNDEMMTERTWIWENDIFIKENISVNLDKSIENYIELVPHLYLPDQAKFTIKNIEIIDQPFNTISSNQLKIVFKIL
jgi:hypothetical protein